MTTTTLGYMKAWLKGSLNSIFEEYEIDSGIMLSGKVQLKREQADELIEYLSDDNNFGQYGAALDFALFHNPDANVIVQGKLTTPYVKGDDTTKTAKTTAKRKI